MNKARDLKHLVLGAVLAASGLSALAAVNLTSFTAGTPIKSSEVNANFSSLGAAIQTLEAPIGPSRLAVTGTAADDKVLKLKAGELVWADDQIGTGGGGGDISAVAAGAGLEGGGTSGDVTLSIGTAFRLPQGCTNGQIPKWNTTAWACGDDAVGTGGGGGDITAVNAGSGLTGGGQSGDVSLSVNAATVQSRVTGSCAAGSSIREVKQDGGVTCEADDNTTYTADGSSVGLAGTMFFVKSAGIGTSQIADGAVTGAKIASPLVLSGDSLSIAYNIKNTNPSGMGLRVDLGNQPNSFVNTAIMGQSTGGLGVYGQSASSIGVLGNSATRGVVGTLGGTSCAGAYGLGGCAVNNIGVLGRSASSYGVYGESAGDNAVYGVATGTNAAVAGTSPNGYGAYFEAGNARCFFKAGTTGWDCASDRKLKENFRPINTTAVLEAVAKMPVTTWSMKGSAIRQLGPTAQDFYAAFKLGDNDTTINATNAQGVALAAIKGLYGVVQKKEARITTLERENRALEDRLAGLEARLQALEKSVRAK